VSRRVVAALAVLLTVSTGLAAPGRAWAQQAAPALEVVLVSISPVVGPGTIQALDDVCTGKVKG